jgi:hypothetical protein
MEFVKFIDKARKLKTNQSGNEVDFLNLLVDQEDNILDWKHPRTPYRSWNELLRGEGLCTPSTYTGYKLARERIPVLWIGKLGVYASISISRLGEADRAKVFGSVKKWYSTRQTAPTYQRISRYVKELHPRKKAPSRAQKMMSYIRTCQSLLRKNKIEVPEETWKKTEETAA